MQKVAKLPNNARFIGHRKRSPTFLITVIILLLCQFANGQNLDKRITLSVQNLSIREALIEVKKQSGIIFAFNSDINQYASKKVSITQKNITVKQAIELIIAGTSLHYKQVDDQLLIEEKPTPTSSDVQTGQGIGMVKGRIVEFETSQPLPGASVRIASLNVGASSNENGYYTLDGIPAGAYTLEVSFVGYSTETLRVQVGSGRESTYDVKLRGSSLLNEVLVVGYGTQKKSSVTGSISSVKSEELTSYAGGTMAEAIAGRAAGVQIVQNSASPGAGGQIKMRGTGTLTAGTAPLVVVDGFPLTEGTSLSTIDPNVITSIEFLKDAASTAIYGSRGANGVVMVTTKQGTTDGVKTSFNTYYGIQQRADPLRAVDAYEMAQYILESRNNGYVSVDPANRNASDDNANRRAKGATLRALIPDYIVPYLNNEPGLVNTDWLDEIFRTAPMVSNTLNLSGGSEKTTYSITGNYFSQDGIIIRTDYKRYSTNINVNTAITDRIKFGISLNPSYSKRNLYDNNGDTSGDPLAMALISYPFFSPYNADGSYNVSEQIRKVTPTDGALGENPVAFMNMVDYTQGESKVFGNAYLSINFLNDFTFKTSLGGDYSNNVTNRFDPSTVGHYRTPAPDPTTASKIIYERKNYLVENVLSYGKTIKKHDVSLLAGQSYQYEIFNNDQITATNFPDDQLRNISGGNSIIDVPRTEEWALISYFARANYNYDNKYLFAASLRRDGSSRFGDNTKWSLFPAVSAGWVVSQESFFSNNNPIVNYLKVRASWGRTGNNQIPNYGARAMLAPSNYVYDGQLAGGYSINTSPNPNLSWEISTSTNVGVDMNLINNFLNVSADYYVANTNGLLLNVPVPEQSGYAFSLQNIGRVRNSGFELQISPNKPIMLGTVKWSLSANLSTNKNKVLALGEGQERIFSGVNDFALTEVGGPIAEMYGYKVTGVYKSQEEIDNSPHLTGTLVGDYVIEDLNGDNVIDSRDRTGFGTGAPELIYGINNAFSYKGFDLSFLWNGEQGKMIYSRPLSLVYGSGEGFGASSKDYFNNRYNPDTNPNGKYAMANTNFSNNRITTRASNINYNNASYIRLRNIRIAYSLPVNLVKKWNLSNLQIYLAANNLVTLTPYKGFSVDATSLNADGSVNPLTQGYDNANYPVARTYTLGINLNL